MWGQVVRSAREWVRLATVYFPAQLHPEALAFIQVPDEEPLATSHHSACCLVPMLPCQCP
jgi:hypothetical protein